jgi:hypothetical protein
MVYYKLFKPLSVSAVDQRLVLTLSHNDENKTSDSKDQNGDFVNKL